MTRARIDKLIMEVDTKIAAANARRDAEVEAFKKRRRVLVETRKALTPELEALLVSLQEVGLL